MAEGEKLRILVGADVMPDPDSGAAGTVYQTNRALRELGHEVDEIWASDLERRIRHGNLHYLLELPRRYRAVVAERCSKKDYDVIQLSQPWAWMAAEEHQRLPRKAVFVNRSHGFELMAENALDTEHARLGTPHPALLRGLSQRAMRRMMRRSTPRVLSSSDGVIVPANDIRQFIISEFRIPEFKVRVVHHGVPASFTSTPLAPMTGERCRRILYVGQYHFIKGPHVLMAVINRVLKSDDRVTVTWVCETKAHASIFGALDSAVRARVTLLEWRDQSKLLEIYDHHGVFLFPSIYEGAGKACLEAMARGLVVVSTRVGAMRDYIEHGVNGFLCEVADIEGFEKCVLSVVSTPDASTSLSGRAATTGRSLTWERCAKWSTEYYLELRERKRLVS